MTVSTLGNAVDGMIAAVVFAEVEVVNGTPKLHSNEVDDASGSGLYAFDIFD